MILGLRIDVCTYDGLRSGVPRLLALMERYGVRASFFVALGPDRSGRAILRILRPGFLAKMRRTQAARVYGWRTILSGTLLPARSMTRLSDGMRSVSAAGHEVAAHGYDHRAWQDRLPEMADATVRQEILRAVDAFRRVFGRSPRAFGAPGWQCSASSLRIAEAMEFAYASDTRGRHPFFPCVGEERLRTLQLPTTLPTLDEALGVEGLDGAGFVDLVARNLGRDPWPVLTLHAEMEGGRFHWVAERLLAICAARGIKCVPLEEMAAAILSSGQSRIPSAEVTSRPIPGRAGAVAMPIGLEPTAWLPDETQDPRSTA